MNSRPRFAILIALACILALAPAASFAQGVLFVTGGDVGINTDTPTQKLHVTSDDGSAQILVDETAAANAIRSMFAIRNNGRPQFFFEDSSIAAEWQFAMKAAGFTIRKTGSGETEIQVDASGRIRFGVGDALGTRLDSEADGDLVILGTLTEGSSKAIKKDFSNVDGSEILEQVAQLPISTWVYKQDQQEARHLGPMAEDFAQAFGLGADALRIEGRGYLTFTETELEGRCGGVSCTIDFAASGALQVDVLGGLVLTF